MVVVLCGHDVSLTHTLCTQEGNDGVKMVIRGKPSHKIHLFSSQTCILAFLLCQMSLKTVIMYYHHYPFGTCNADVEHLL